jgi:hypothetical protein
MVTGKLSPAILGALYMGGDLLSFGPNGSSALFCLARPGLRSVHRDRNVLYLSAQYIMMHLVGVLAERAVLAVHSSPASRPPLVTCPAGTAVLSLQVQSSDRLI